MADHPDRDRSIEHLLRQARPRSSSAPDGCVDAERLAAWSDGSLRPEESALVETHLADCARCQAMLAVFAQSAPAMPVVVPFWRRWTVRWLVPVAAASAAVLVWVVVTRQPEDAASTTMARVEPFDASAGGPGIAPLPAPVEESVADEARGVSTLDAPAAQRRGAVAQAPPPPAPSRDLSAAADESAAKMAREIAAAPVAPPPPPPPRAAPSPTRIPSSRSEDPIDPAGVVVTANPAIQAQTGERSFSTARSAPGQSNVMMDGIGAVSEAVPADARRDPTSPVEFGAPAPPAEPQTAVTAEAARPPVRWRLMPDGRLMRSPDGGRSWSVVAFDPAVAIGAGSAPSALVCWLVSGEGDVLRSVDGATFERTASPVDAALVSIRAVDAIQATVVADDGRVFTTTDGGSTWRELP